MAKLFQFLLTRDNVLYPINYDVPVPQQAERATERQAVGAAGGAGRAAGRDAQH